MPATIIAPEAEPQVEARPAPIRTKPAPVDAPKPATRKQRVRDLLVAIFEGHEEFLGWTPEQSAGNAKGPCDPLCKRQSLSVAFIARLRLV